MSAARDLYSLGVIGPWYLRDSQLDIYDLIASNNRPFIECCRRFGKTTTIIVFILEMLKQNPGWICRWCGPWQKQVRQTIKPIVSQIQSFAKESDRFEYRTEDTHYIHPNGSKLYIVGVNDDKGESARGPAANIIVADEYGTWKDPTYIIKSILFPQLEGQKGRWLIKASTPPPDLGHVYYLEKEEAAREERFIQKIIWHKENLSQEEIEEIIKETGGMDSDAFKREYLCLPVANSEMLVIPEWGENEDALIFDDPYERPAFADKYVGGDSGFDDNTFLIFGFYDFENDTLMIEDELLFSNETSKVIVEAAKKKESKLWRGETPYTRVYDANKQLLWDVSSEHKYPVVIPNKDHKAAAINQLRVRIREQKLKIHKNCENLRRQLRVGLWKDEKHLDFQRTEGLGHLDGLAALMYLNRSVNTRRNPFPAKGSARNQTHFIPDHLEAPEAREPELSRLARSFKTKRG